MLLRLARLPLSAVDGHRQVVDRSLRGHQVGMVRVRAACVLQQRLKFKIKFMILIVRVKLFIYF